MKAHEIIKSVLALSLAVIAVTSCQEKLRFGFTKGEVVKFSVGTEGSSLDTKAAYSGDVTETSTIERIDWKENDLIRIYCAEVSEPENKYADYVVTSVDLPTSGATVSKAHIEGTGGVGLRWGEGDHYFYGIAPAANIAKGSESPNHVIATGNVSTSQTPGTPLTENVSVDAGETFKVDADMTNMFMAAKAGPYSETGTQVDEEDGVFMSFTPLTTAIEFTITNDTGADIVLSSVSLISGNGKSTAPVINGNFSIDLDLDSWATPADAKPADGSMTVTYGRAYPACTGTDVSADEEARTITIPFGKNVTLEAKSGETKGGSLTFTFLLTPTHDFEDLTFKLTKSDDSWMSTRLGYTDGSGIFFPHFKKTKVEGLFIPEGAQWTVNYGSAGSDDSDAVTLLTSWDMGETGDLNFGDEEPETDLLPGKFSISATKYVQFSRGNLQATYHSATSSYTWDFAANQYDFIGNASGNTSIKSDGSNNDGAVVDLFGWSTAATNYGINASQEVTTYSGEFKDWGTAIEGTWSTLTMDEWQYLFNFGINSNATRNGLYAYGVTVVGKPNCVVLYPDGFAGTKVTNGDTSSYDTEDKWSAAQEAGVVCLPAAGYRVATVKEAAVTGSYWSSSKDDGSTAFRTRFDDDEVNPADESCNRYAGYSVRLVQKSFKPHDAVKIGNVYWATTNIGADTPTDMGWYFYWAGKTGYVHDGSKWVAAQDGSELAGAFYLESTPYHTGSDYNKNWTKYVPTDKSEYWTGTGDPDNKTVIDPEDDAARANWGGFWRMPTSAEFQAMKDATYWAWDSTDNGYYVYTPNPATDAGKMNSSGAGTYNKSNALLFFPATGCGMAAGHDKAGTTGYYWSSTLKLNDPSYAYYLQFTNATLTQGGGRRSYGLSVRPVHD